MRYGANLFAPPPDFGLSRKTIGPIVYMRPISLRQFGGRTRNRSSLAHRKRTKASGASSLTGFRRSVYLATNWRKALPDMGPDFCLGEADEG